jgi:hypothetical protein
MMALLIREDPPAGKPFWMTRPIFNKSLLASKCAFVFLFGAVIPLAANFIILFHYGLEPQRMLSCLMDCLSTHLAVLFSLFAIAVLTPNLLYFFVVVILGQILFQLIDYLPALEAFPLQAHVRAGLAILFSILVVFHQYRTRRRALSAMIFIAGMLLTFGTDIDWYIAKYYRAMASARDPEIDNLKLTFYNQNHIKVRAVKIDGSLKTISGKRNLIIGLDISNVHPSVSVELLRLKGMLFYNDGTKIPLDCTLTNLLGETGAPEIALHAKVCQVDEIVFDKYSDRTGDFSGEAIFNLVHYSTEGRLPLKQGSFFKKGSQFLSVYRPAPLSEETAPAILRERYLVSDSENLWPPIATLETESYPELTLPRKSPGYRSLIIFAGPGLVYSERACIGLPRGSGGSSIDTEQLSHMEIRIRNKTATGPFIKKMEMKNVRMADYTFEAWAGQSRP